MKCAEIEFISVINAGHWIMILFSEEELEWIRLVLFGSFGADSAVSLQKTRLFKYVQNFTTKTESFQIKIMIFFTFLLKT